MPLSKFVWKSLPRRLKDDLKLLYWWFKVRNQGSPGTGYRKALAIGCEALTRLRARRKYIAFYPDVPQRSGYVIRKIVKILGFSPTNHLSARTVATIKWRDTTFPPSCQKLVALANVRPVINVGLEDISKKRVDETFRQVFGYSTFVDPTLHSGLAVQKSIFNARHDGQVIQCPIEDPLAEVVYQRLIHNEIGGNLVEDIRLPIFGRNIPFAYLKHRPKEFRFANTNSSAKIVLLKEVLTRGEVEGVLRFCRAMGLDYGELDVLRDSQDGRLYIVDVNSTPYGPPNHLGTAEAARAILVLANTFRNEFL